MKTGLLWARKGVAVRICFCYVLSRYAKPIQYLFNQCVINSCIPAEWKIHKITPIHKAGDKSSVKNYRPISLLCCISKVLERIIYDNIINRISSKVISVHRFGFLRGRSTTQQLLMFQHCIINSLVDKCQTDVIYLDIQKAFDTISHNILLSPNFGMLVLLAKHGSS